MTEQRTYEVLSRTDQFRGRIISVRTDEVQMSDGVAVRDVVMHPGAVAIVALDHHDRIVVVTQYRHPVVQVLDELPAGLLDVRGEPAITAAQRELYEEAGLAAGRWHVLLDLLTSPGMTDEAIRVFLARDLSPAGGDFVREHEEATMTDRWVSLDDAVGLALSGRLTNAVACAGILGAYASRAGGWRSLRPANAAWADRP